jgi:hypothetical protein
MSEPYDSINGLSCYGLGTVTRAPEVRIKAGPAKVLLIAPRERQGAT